MTDEQDMPIGCFTCERCQVIKAAAHERRCQLHHMAVTADHLCKELVSRDDPKSTAVRQLIRSLEPETLYLYAEAKVDWYPPPMELVFLAGIEDYKSWDNAQKTQATRDAVERATQIYQEKHTE